MLFEFLQSVAVGLFVIGAFQAVLLLVALHRRKGNKTVPSHLLTGLLMAMSFVLLHHSLYASLPPDWPWRYAGSGLAAAVWFSIPPIYLLYVRSLVQPARKLVPKTHYYLFLPAAYHLVSWVAELSGLYLPWYRWLGDYRAVYLYVWVGSYVATGLWCTALATRFLARTQVPGAVNPELGWLRGYTRWFRIALLATGGILLGLALTNSYHVLFEYSLLAVFATFTIGLAYRSIRRPDTTARLSDQLYGDAAVASDRLPELHTRLRQHMLSNRPYLNPELRRSDLASATGISEHDLSQLFSRHLGTNFYTYVNGFRLAAFEARLTDGSLEQLTMAALAQACGFKSKTSLYRVFREKHETTPGEYLKQRSVGVGR